MSGILIYFLFEREAVSYTNYCTNIHRLYSLYTRDNNSLQFDFYIEGFGTGTDQPDSLSGLRQITDNR